MILPPVPRAIMRRAACLETMNALVRLVSITRCQSLNSSSTSGLRNWMPALLMTMSTCTPSLSHCANASATACSSVTSKARPWASNPLLFSRAAASATVSARVPFKITLAPAVASPSASAKPMPRAEPVTSAVRPLKSNSCVMRCSFSGCKCETRVRPSRGGTPVAITLISHPPVKTSDGCVVGDEIQSGAIFEVLLRALDERKNRLFRSRQVACLDRDTKRFMHRQRTGRAAGYFGAEFEARAQDRRQRVLHLLDELVVAGGKDRAVEREVGGNVFTVAGDGTLHRLEGTPHRDAILRRRTFCSELGRIRLDDQPQLHQVLDQALVYCARPRTPGDHVRIEQLPFRTRQHDRAVTPAHFKHALGGERFHRLADCDAAHLHLLGEHGLGGKNIPRRKLARANLLAHLIQDLPM